MDYYLVTTPAEIEQAAAFAGEVLVSWSRTGLARSHGDCMLRPSSRRRSTHRRSGRAGPRAGHRAAGTLQQSLLWGQEWTKRGDLTPRCPLRFSQPFAPLHETLIGLLFTEPKIFALPSPPLARTLRTAGLETFGGSVGIGALRGIWLGSAGSTGRRWWRARWPSACCWPGSTMSCGSPASSAGSCTGSGRGYLPRFSRAQDSSDAGRRAEPAGPAPCGC